MTRFLSTHKFTIVFAALGLVILLFILVPLLKMVFASSPGDVLDALLDDKEVRDAIWLTLYASFISAAVGMIFGVPLAYLLARRDFPGKKVVEAIIDLPVVIPHTAAGIALLFVFGSNFFGGQFFHAFGLDFFDAVPGIVIAMMFVSIPFLINAAKEGFKSVDPRLEKVARTLGASPRQTFFQVSLPLAGRSIMSGGVMMWARGVSEFGAVIIIAYYPMIAPTLVYQRYETQGLDGARNVAVVLLLVCLAIFIALRYLTQKGGRP
ncbi:MAG: ABC transporter permease [Dehalococcoidia bacterium]|nr:ABC transporter permease [Dehalococcoidia bacterium]